MARKRNQISAALLAAAAVMTCPTAAWAQEAQIYQFDLPAQDLGDALRVIAAKAGLELYARADEVNQIRVPSLHGRLTAQKAIEQLLAQTDLRAHFDKKAVIIRGRSKGAIEEDKSLDADIVVTGTHIRGSAPTSPVIAANRRQIQEDGMNDLGEYIRTLPQNFGGGQSPGIVGGGNQGGNENLNSSSDLNLRGLGPDATLTLINGHRVAYDGAIQGVDISTIPLVALDRIEIVPDGASALYGSDAVGGVANVILRDDFDGLSTSARLGATTDGGDTQQQYDIVGGNTWGASGIMVAGDYNRSTAITARQRSYTQNLNGSATLLPRQHQISIIGTGHQALTKGLKLLLDAEYSDRKSAQALPSTTTTAANVNGVVSAPKTKTYSITPTLELALPSTWRLSLTGTIGRSLTRASSSSYSSGVAVSQTFVRYDNRIKSVELDGDGRLFRLPGGEVRIAAGAGYRSLSLASIGRIGTPAITLTAQDIAARQNVAYAFSEISIPVIGVRNRLPLITALRLSAALRYEDYDDLAHVASPKIGVIYRPMPDVTIRSSWGKSFKAPTFYQRYKISQAILYPSSAFGGSDPTQTALYIAGGNPDLQPERATTWTATTSFTPPFIPSFQIEANYFHIRYRDRVVTPITSTLGLFGNPLYQNLVTYHPTAAQLSTAIGQALLGLQNFSGLSYDPADVYAIIDGNLQNSALEKIKGVDLSVSYRIDHDDDHLDLSGSASYLDSRRQLIADQLLVPVSGVIFMPPHWRARGGGIWHHGPLTLSSFVNYTGGTLDNRMLPYVRVGSFVTLDIGANIASTEKSGLLSKADVLLSILNVANKKPAVIRNSTITDPTYDTTNYSAIGRTISLTVSKRW